MSIKECRCPTCGAVQSWRDECRRCGTDISLLRRLADESRRLQGELLDALSDNDLSKAQCVMERLLAVSTDPLYELLHGFIRHRGGFPAAQSCVATGTFAPVTIKASESNSVSS